jgi:uncharacterized protein
VNALIREQSEAMAELCRRYHVARLELFGSACTPEFDLTSSDLDFLVEFLPGADLGPWLSRLFELQGDLRSLTGRRVDLVMSAALRNQWFRREADKTRELIYDASHIIIDQMLLGPGIRIQDKGGGRSTGYQSVDPKVQSGNAQRRASLHCARESNVPVEGPRQAFYRCCRR